ncbi:hypothetical protein PPTG_24294 [Phytophthora nicotianae INRA-310]|uniref:Uncharacterized protein n=1 Tax=Phytophthora nicotianae (strain INRA-310) TaxID=761204 RepID=W2PGN6_PHYN3|nr:hypothetical protein PPTG_24294 [Phytophthora nicotianae INRA-310]ETN00203.1 hypothetical protein PPTG_24294 [Phytophthora nicotianae INRA-310]
MTEDELRLTQETTTRTAVIQGSDTRRQVEALAHHSAAAHQRAAEQIGQEMRRQMDEHRQYLEEQYEVLREAERAVGIYGQRLESLAEAVQPHLQARSLKRKL